ncbi:uncharacterized protein L201_007560 [Kwoniella dendrophila CBS 6074]|uniref:DASH complex subunit DAM1 n=1 Tax=Kwoniella dendrophila CBS 6074 TaxID=1295534 RepID=A0AAX4K4R1_9TREE
MSDSDSDSRRTPSPAPTINSSSSDNSNSAASTPRASAVNLPTVSTAVGESTILNRKRRSSFILDFNFGPTSKTFRSSSSQASVPPLHLRFTPSLSSQSSSPTPAAPSPTPTASSQAPISADTNIPIIASSINDLVRSVPPLSFRIGRPNNHKIPLKKRIGPLVPAVHQNSPQVSAPLSRQVNDLASELDQALNSFSSAAQEIHRISAAVNRFGKGILAISQPAPASSSLNTTTCTQQPTSLTKRTAVPSKSFKRRARKKAQKARKDNNNNNNNNKKNKNKNNDQSEL